VFGFRAILLLAGRAAHLEAVRQQPSARFRRPARDGGRVKQAHQWETSAMGHDAFFRIGETTWMTQFPKFQMSPLRWLLDTVPGWTGYNRSAVPEICS
jgi:hypothetical protein